MDPAEHVSVLEVEGRRLADAAGRAGLGSDVPSCPQWRVRDVLQHTGAVHRWATLYLTSGKAKPSAEDRQVFSLKVADTELVEWFSDGHRLLVRALRDADSETRCWSFLPAPSPLAFWARRQAHETSIHRVDAELPTGGVTAFGAEFAADGIDELLTGFLSRMNGSLVAEHPVSLGVESTDTDKSWTVRIDRDRAIVERGCRGADCLLRGTASDLYLFLWNRGDQVTSTIDSEGDRSLLTMWRERAAI